MACSACSGNGLNGGINANIARADTLKKSRGQKYVRFLIPLSQY